ncbi:hypothetical protein ACFXPA_47845 [Amycolatopsis sp. NPDC059090]|uniref:hypothetical protein n=1 Tax=Amycolatopsis sp. NPDC059090 TaxID=3346723 RepID=UPI00366F939F
MLPSAARTASHRCRSSTTSGFASGTADATAAPAVSSGRLAWSWGRWKPSSVMETPKYSASRR